MSFLNLLQGLAAFALPVPMMLTSVAGSMAFTFDTTHNRALRDFSFLGHVLLPPTMIGYVSAVEGRVKPTPVIWGIMGGSIMLSAMVYGVDRAFRRTT